MTGWITALYLVALASFAPPMVLAGLQWTRAQSPLASKFLLFQAAHLAFLAGLLAAFLWLSLAPERALATEVFLNTAFYLLYALVLRFFGRFVFELLQRRWEGPWRNGIEAIAALGPMLALGVHALVYEGETRALVLRVVLNAGYFVLFLAAVAALIGLGLREWKGTTDPWKRRTLGGSGLIFVVALPFFVVDALWPILQLEQGLIPRGLNLQILPVLAWNLFFAARWFVFPSAELPEALGGEVSPMLLALMTQRERELAQWIIAGKTNPWIADHLGVRLSTVKNHVYNIFNKTGASSRKELASMLLDRR